MSTPLAHADDFRAPEQAQIEWVMLDLQTLSKDVSVTEADLRAHCKESLTAYKVPRQIVFVEALPKSSVGKILRRELRDGK